MAGGLTISTLNNDTGVLATQNGMTGIAKAWVKYNGSTQTINNSFNISSVTYNSAGVYTLNFTTAMANSNYVIAGSAGLWGTANTFVQANPSLTSTTSVQVASVFNSGVESNNFQVVVFGN